MLLLLSRARSEDDSRDGEPGPPEGPAPAPPATAAGPGDDNANAAPLGNASDGRSTKLRWEAREGGGKGASCLVAESNERDPDETGSKGGVGRAPITSTG